MKNRYLIIILLAMILIPFINAETSGGTLIGKQYECISLPQECADCTYVKLTTVTFPNLNKTSIQTNMVKDGTSFSYNFCNTTQTGDYVYCVVGDVGGTDTVSCNDFEITINGKVLSIPESILYTLFTIILIILLLVMFSFIIILPGTNERNSNNEIIGILKIKYVKIFLIAMSYPALLIILNLMNGLASSIDYLSIFSGTIGFLFEMLLRGVWIFTFVIFIWIFYFLVQDSNFNKKIRNIGSFRLNGRN